MSKHVIPHTGLGKTGERYVVFIDKRYIPLPIYFEKKDEAYLIEIVQKIIKAFHEKTITAHYAYAKAMISRMINSNKQ